MATGTNYPTSRDSWTNKGAIDDVSYNEFNARTSAIEQLELYLDYLRTYSARVTKSAQSIASGSWTDLLFDVETFDAGGFHSNSVYPQRLTAPLSGTRKYEVVAQASFSSMGGTQRGITVKRNSDSSYIAVTLISPQASGSLSTQVNTGLFEMTANDYVTVQIWHDVGSPMNVDAWATIRYAGD